MKSKLNISKTITIGYQENFDRASVDVITFNWDTPVKSLVDDFYSKVAHKDIYNELFEANKAETVLNKKLLLTNLLIQELAATPVKYNTKTKGPQKKEFRLNMAMLRKLAHYASGLSAGREDTIKGRGRKETFLSKIKQLWR
jgi:hypothetical protein